MQIKIKFLNREKKSFIVCVRQEWYFAPTYEVFKAT